MLARQPYTQLLATRLTDRAFSTVGMRHVHQVHGWTLAFTESEKKQEEYRENSQTAFLQLDFWHIYVTYRDAHTLQSVEIHTSTNRCCWNYEEALCARQAQTGNGAGRVRSHDLDRDRTR